MVSKRWHTNEQNANFDHTSTEETGTQQKGIPMGSETAPRFTRKPPLQKEQGIEDGSISHWCCSVH